MARDHSEDDIIEMLHQSQIESDHLVSTNYLGGTEYELAFDTAYNYFNEDELFDDLQAAGFEPTDTAYESPSDRGFAESDDDYIPYFYVTIAI